jgi:O-antigen/teichoic acid export membrane protein
VGAYTVASAAVIVASMIADWGATRALPRNLAVLDREEAIRFVRASNGFRMMLAATIIAIAVIAALSGRLQHNIGTYLLILVPLVPLSVIANTAMSERVATGNVQAIAGAVIGGFVTFAALGALLIRGGAGPAWFAASYVVGKVIETTVLASGRWWVAGVQREGSKATAIALWPFAAQMIMGVIYSRLSVFTMERMSSRVELGVFSVAMAFQSALVLVPASLALTGFPALTTLLRKGDRVGVRHALIRYTIVSFAGVTFGLALFVLLRTRIAAALNVPSSFVPFVVAFAALALLGTFSMKASYLLQAMGLEGLVARLSVVTLGLALVYQIVGLKLLGVWGIVAAVGMAELTTVSIFGLAIRSSRKRSEAAA